MCLHLINLTLFVSDKKLTKIVLHKYFNTFLLLPASYIQILLSFFFLLAR